MNHYYGQEWELLDDELMFTRYINIAGIEIDDFSVRISVKRNSEYIIIGTLVGEKLEAVIKKYQSMQSGDIIQPISIRGWNESGGGTYVLTEVYFGSINQTYKHGSNNKFSIDLNIKAIRYQPNENIIHSVTKDWFINAPKRTELFNDISYRSDDRIIRIERGDYKSSYFLKQENGSPRNYMSFEIDNWNIYVEKCIIVDREDLNDFKPLSITYIPISSEMQLSDELRTSISDVLSIYFGKPLIQIGSSYLNTESEIVYMESFNPIFPTDRKFLGLKEEVFIGDPYPLNEKYKLVENFKVSLEKYMELKKNTKIDELLWRYWISRDHFISLQLPTLVSGLEIFIKSYLDLSKQFYISENDFDAIYSQISNYVNDNYKGKSDIDIVLSKIKGANRISIGKMYEQFFNDLGLEYSSKIKKAITVRNVLVHNGMSKKVGSELKTINNLLIVRTTINRVLLKLLDYKGGYIDRSSRGFELKKIDEY